MLRTNPVKLTVIPAMAYRHKFPAGGSGITILRPDVSQPGIAAISKTSGEPIPSANTDLTKYPPEAFLEAMKLTRGMTYRKLPSFKVTADMVAQPEPEAPEVIEEETPVNEEAYARIVEHYTDKNGKLSYDLLNKELIRFAKSSSVVRGMVEEKKSAAAIRNYIVSNKFRNIAGNDDLTKEELKRIVDLLDEVSPKYVFHDLNAEIRKMLGEGKRK